MSRFLTASTVSLLLFAAHAGVAQAQSFVLRAFGDSITDGYGDTTSLAGYPARLERRLRQAGYDVVVSKHGVGGETTLAGLSRIDSVLRLGGDFVLLMEGTNDISQRVSIETIRFNLDEMARRADEAGITPVHATVIPRIPTASQDGDNARTSALATALLELGDEAFRAVADVFHHFESLPQLFEYYYYYDEQVPDIVGHPNQFGYIEIAGVFFDTVKPLLDGPQLQIVPPPAPVATGAVTPFRVQTNGVVSRVEWTFGEDGFAVSEAGPDFPVSFLFPAAGPVQVRATGFNLVGPPVVDETTITVSGTAPSWQTRSVLIPNVAAAVDGPIVTDLELLNPTGNAGFVDLTPLPDIRYDDPPPTRRLFLPVGGTSFDDVFAGLFGADGVRGGLLVEARLPVNVASAGARAVLRSPAGEARDGCVVEGLGLESVTSATKQIGGISYDAGETVSVEVVNPDASAGSVRLDLYDGASAYVGSGMFDLAAGAARGRELDDLFRELAGRPQPFSAFFFSAGGSFSAHAAVSGDENAIHCFASAP